MQDRGIARTLVDFVRSTPKLPAAVRRLWGYVQDYDKGGK